MVKQINDKKVVITGSSGFVGQSLINFFLSQNYSVLGLSRTTPKNNELPAEVIYQAVDISNPVAETFPDFQGSIVIHTAALTKGSKEHLWKANVVGTYNVLDWAIKHQASKFIFFSTGGIYGYQKHYCKEDSPTSPIGVYGHTKWIGEQICTMYAGVYDLPVVTFRLYFPFGKHQSKGIFSFVHKAIKDGSPIQINLEGAPRFTPIHLSDVVSACRQVIEQDISSCSFKETYNLCGDESLSFFDLVSFFEKRLHCKANVQMTHQACENLLGDNSKLRSIGWRPKETLSSIKHINFDN